MMDDDEAIGFKSNTLAKSISADVLAQWIHRLVSSLSEYELEGKGKAYADD